MLPSLTTVQVNELILESQGRAVSYVDEPEWFIGQRHVTWMARDGVVATEEHASGSMSSLAYSLCDHVREYQRLQSSIETAEHKIKWATADIEKEYARKTPRKRYLENLYQDLRWAQQDVTNCRQRISEITAKYFRGYEGRLLIA